VSSLGLGHFLDGLALVRRLLDIGVGIACRGFILDE